MGAGRLLEKGAPDQLAVRPGGVFSGGICPARASIIAAHISSEGAGGQAGRGVLRHGGGGVCPARASRVAAHVMIDSNRNGQETRHTYLFVCTLLADDGMAMTVCNFRAMHERRL